MKRVIISLAMLALIGLVGWYCIWQISTVHEEIYGYTNEIEVLLRQEDREGLMDAVDRLCVYWQDTEHGLGHIVRHSQIDEITKAIARLPPLAEYLHDADLLAELHSIRWQIDHIKESEYPTLQNLF